MDPNAYWCVQDAFVQTAYEKSGWYTRRQRIEYGEKRAGLPQPKMVTIELKLGENLINKTSFEFSEITDNEFPQTVFSLSEFGLSNLEVPREPSVNRSLAYISLAASATFLVLGLLIRGAAQRVN